MAVNLSTSVVQHYICLGHETFTLQNVCIPVPARLAALRLALLHIHYRYAVCCKCTAGIGAKRRGLNRHRYKVEVR